MLGVDHGACVVVRIEVAQIVPRRLEERVHRVALAARRPAAFRAGRVDERRIARERRAFAGDRHVGRQQDRQLVVGDRHFAAALAVDDRNRRAPIALPRDEPIAQAVVDARLAPTPIAARRSAIALRARALDMPLKSSLAIKRPSSTYGCLERRGDRRRPGAR